MGNEHSKKPVSKIDTPYDNFTYEITNSLFYNQTVSRYVKVNGEFYFKTESKLGLKGRHGMSKYLEKVFKVPIVDIEDFSPDLSQKVDLTVTIKDIITIDEKVELDEPLLRNDIESMLFMEILDPKRTYFVKHKYDIIYFELKFNNDLPQSGEQRSDDAQSLSYGFLDQITEINSTVSKVLIKKQQQPLVPVEELAIGGMQREVALFKSLIQTRQQSLELLKKYNIKQQKGVFIHGEPGTGKTYFAMNIVKAMRHRSLTIVNGNEIVDKYQGESERKCRELFAKAETDPDKSNLHILIFDECETLFGKRKDSHYQTNTPNNLVNILLSKIDGCYTISNIFIIAITNRLDMIDPAFMRSGRLDVCLEFKFPDFEQRIDILKTCLKPFIDNGRTDGELDYSQISVGLEHFSHADIASHVSKVALKLLEEVEFDEEKMSLSTNDLKLV